MWRGRCVEGEGAWRVRGMKVGVKVRGCGE